MSQNPSPELLNYLNTALVYKNLSFYFQKRLNYFYQLPFQAVFEEYMIQSLEKEESTIIKVFRVKKALQQLKFITLDMDQKLISFNEVTQSMAMQYSMLFQMQQMYMMNFQTNKKQYRNKSKSPGKPSRSTYKNLETSFKEKEEQRKQPYIKPVKVVAQIPEIKYSVNDLMNSFQSFKNDLKVNEEFKALNDHIPVLNIYAEPQMELIQKTFVPPKKYSYASTVPNSLQQTPVMQPMQAAM